MTPAASRSRSTPSTSSRDLDFPVSGAERFELANGMEVIVKRDTTAPLVSVQVWVRTGSIFESDLLGGGVSHLVEHMVFQGAGSRGPGELAKAVQETGGYLNAYTSFDRTVYWVDTLREGLDTSLGVLADLTTRATFPVAEFEKEKDVIRREIDMGRDDPNRAVGQLMFSTVYREHPFREPVIGRLEIFNAVDRDTAFRYYQQRYQPSRMFLVVVGDTDVEAVRELAEKHFGQAEGRFSPPVHVADEPPQSGRRDAHVEFATEMTRMELAWRIPGLQHPDTPALEVLGMLTGTGRASRFFREIRERQGLVHSIGAGAYTPVQGGLFYVSAETEPDQREAAELAILEQLRRVREEGVTAGEVDRARRLFLADQFQGLSSMRGQASDLGGNWHSAHHLDFTRDYLSAIGRVTPEDVVRVARLYLDPAQVTSVSINPKGSLAQKRAEAAAVAPGEVRRHVFANGLILLVREDPRLPAVSLHACLRGGLLAESAATNGAGRLMARTIIKGTATRTATEIADLIENGGGSIGAETGGSSFSVSAQVLEPDWRACLDLMADVLLTPQFPEEEVTRERVRQLAAIRQEEDHPSFVAFRELRRAAYGTHPLALSRNGSAESVETLDRETLSELHASLLATGNTVLAVFGDVKFDEVRDAAAAAFAAMPVGPRRAQGADLPLPAWTAGEISVTSDKRQAFLVAAFPTVDLRHPDRLALDLLDEACSDMASRFFERIREQHGLAYSVGTAQVLGMAPGLFTFHLSTAPEKLEFAKAELLSEIQNLAEGGLAVDELERARRTWIGKQAMQAQSNGGLAQQSSLNELYGLGHDHEERVIERVRILPLEEVNAVAKRYFGALAPIVVTVAPGLETPAASSSVAE